MGNPTDKNKISKMSIHSQHNFQQVTVQPKTIIINKSAVMNASCRHFDEYLLYYGLDAFNVVHGIFSTSVSAEALRKKVSVCSHSAANDLQWLCAQLICSFLDCCIYIID